VNLEQRPLAAEDRPLVVELLESIDAFTDAERAVALELVDARLSHPEIDDYRFLLAFATDDAPRLAGYLCYGRTPMTQAAYDLYWLATSPACARMGVARALVSSMEEEIAHAGGGVVRVETGSREGHGAAVQFYDSLGYARATTIDDFYAPGDDLILFTRRIPADGALARREDQDLDEAALYDAAFGYRDYDKERDFLLTCARRFGTVEPHRVLAWASGSGRHLVAFADAGIGGLGVEPSPALATYGERLLRARNAADARIVEGPLDERLRDVAPFDLSFVPLSSVHQLVSEDALVRHLEAAAAALRAGGVHVIEATHPADLGQSGVNHTEWTELRDGLVIDARFKMHIDRIADDRTVPVTLDVVCNDAGKKGPPRGRLKQEDRWFIPDLPTWQSIAARVPELELVAALGDFNADVSFDHAAAWRLILVFRKR
jgi:ribosomal protein S18 acetylase RimI-like enzyme